MTITTIQKVIKIGSSRGVTLPARDLKLLGVEAGDEVELVVRKKVAHADDTAVLETVQSLVCHGGGSSLADDTAVLETVQSLLERYEDDFRHLAER